MPSETLTRQAFLDAIIPTKEQLDETKTTSNVVSSSGQNHTKEDKPKDSFVGTLLDMTKLDPETANKVLELLSKSGFSPKSQGTSGAIDPLQLMFNSERKEANVPDLHKIAGSTQDG